MIAINTGQMIQAVKTAYHAKKRQPLPETPKEKLDPRRKKPRKPKRTATEKLADSIVFEKEAEKQDRAFAKCFLYIISEIGARYQREALEGKTIEISLESFVQARVFKNKKSAKRTLTKLIPVFLGLSVKDEKSEDSQDFSFSESEKIARFFSSIEIKGMILRVALNYAQADLIDWNKIFKEYGYAPEYLFSLESLEFNTLYYLCRIARIDRKKGVLNSKKTCLCVETSLKNLAKNAGLPLEGKRVKDKTVKPILEALEGIQRAEIDHQDLDSESDIQIHWKLPDVEKGKDPIKDLSGVEILETPVFINITGETLSAFSGIGKRKRKSQAKKKTSRN